MDLKSTLQNIWKKILQLFQKKPVNVKNDKNSKDKNVKTVTSDESDISKGK